MPIKRDAILIVDIESTCWQDNLAPPDQRSEIIEIGVCVARFRQREITDKRSIFVTPTESEISPFCTQLTTLTPEQIAENGIPFAEACAILRDDYRAQDYLWASWGNYDHRMFNEQCARRAIEYPFSDHHLNIKTLFANVSGAAYRPGMAQALKLLDMPLHGTHHRGDDDAYNIARILHRMLDDHGVAILSSFW